MLQITQMFESAESRETELTGGSVWLWCQLNSERHTCLDAELEAVHGVQCEYPKRRGTSSADENY